MKAIVLNEAGGIDKLIYQDIEKPLLKSGKILVKIKNIGMNPMDVYIRSNEQFLTHFLGSERPAIPGWDISGEVRRLFDSIGGISFDGEAYFVNLVVKPDATENLQR